MTPEAERILARAHARADARSRAYVPPDPGAANRAFRRQKAALTRALRSGDPDCILLTVAQTVAEWGRAPFNGAWPDDWSRWQRALDDSLPFGTAPRLEDL